MGGIKGGISVEINHHLRDDSFVARFGRAPDAADPEPLRMRVHLEYVRDYLAARPATRPGRFASSCAAVAAGDATG